MHNRYRFLLIAAALLAAVSARAIASNIELASLPPPEPPKPADQSKETGPLLDDGSVVMEVRT